MYAAVMILGALAVHLINNLVSRDIAVKVMNALLLPLALGLLVLLATRALPEEDRVTGGYKWLVYAVSAAAILFGLDESGLI